MNRTLAIMKSLGWQGGTVHQLVPETGLTVDQILYGTPADKSFASPYNIGWMIAKEGTVPLSQGVKDRHRGNLDFWLGIADGMPLRA